MYARASRTSRRWGFCSADPWTEDEAILADRLLKGLEAVRATQRAALQRGGVNIDADKWIWPGGAPGCERLLRVEAERLVAESGVSSSDADRVVRKLLDRDEQGSAGPFLHVAAVKEALGCLIPEGLHKTLDARVANGGRGVAEKRSVDVFAGRFSLDFFKAQILQEESRNVPKDVLEFFLIVARHFCAVFELSVEIGHHKLGETVGTEHVMHQLLASVSGWRAWNVEHVRSKSVWILPVCVCVCECYRRPD